MPKYSCFCNECGHKGIVGKLKEFEFCPECGHVNTGYVVVETVPARKIRAIQVYKPTKAELTDSPEEQAMISALSRKLYYRFIEENKIVSGQPCYNWVKLGSSKHNNIDGRFKTFLDNGALFVRENEEKLLVTQPLYGTSGASERTIICWAEERGLEVRINEGSSWCHPGKAALLIFEIKDISTFDKYIEENNVPSFTGHWLGVD